MNDSIVFVGDVHGRFDLLRSLIDKTKCTAVVVAGDFGFWLNYAYHKYEHELGDPFKVPVYFVDGNHEHHDMLTDLVDMHGVHSPIDVGNNAFYIPRGCVFELGGYRICGAGGAFSIDYMLRVPHRSWFEQEQFTTDDLKKFDRNQHVDIVVSHTCPFAIFDQLVDSLPMYIDNDQFASEKALDSVLTMYKPNLWIFGHWHHQGTYKHENTTFHLLNMLRDHETFKQNIQYFKLPYKTKE